MSNELKVLRLFCDSREKFDATSPHFKEIKNLDREIMVVFNLVSQYYKQYPSAEKISVEDLKIFYDLHYPMSKDKTIYFSLFDDMFSSNVNIELLNDLLENTIERHISAQIMAKLMPVVEGQASGKLISVKEDVESFISKMRRPPSQHSELTPISYSLQELVDMEINYKGLPWFLPSLTKTIGGARRKTLGLIYAFVDAGKTSFSCAAAAGFAKELKDTDEKIIYAGNEEAGSRVSLRVNQAILKKTRHEIATDVKAAEEELKTLGRDRLLVYDSINNITQVEKLLDTIRPMIMFVDQGVKVKVGAASANDEDVKHAQLLFNYYRELAKYYNVCIICIAQAVGEAENRKYLKLSDIYGSRVAIQGELDFAIGIGRVIENLAEQDFRFINIPKNKLDEGDGHRFTTLFTRYRCTFEEI